jgi:hypothetical protein
MATRYGLDALRFESRWGTRYPGPIQTVPEAHPASYTKGTQFPGGKAAGVWCWPLTPSSARVKHGWSCTSSSPLCMHGMLRDSFATSRFAKEILVSNFRKEICECTADLCNICYMPHLFRPPLLTKVRKCLQILSLSLAWAQHLTVGLLQPVWQNLYISSKNLHFIKWFCHIELFFLSFFFRNYFTGDQGLLIHKLSRSHSDTPHSIGLLWTSDNPSQRPLSDNTRHWRQTSMPPGGIRTHSPGRRAVTDPLLRPRGHRERHI